MKIDLEKLFVEHGYQFPEALAELVKEFRLSRKKIPDIIHTLLKDRIHSIRHDVIGYTIELTPGKLVKNYRLARTIESKLRKLGKEVVLAGVAEDCFIIKCNRES